MGGKRRVLLVQDQPAVRRHMKECLRQLGVEAIEASNGRAAMNELAAECPALVCTDVSLPEISGFELCDFIRRTPHLRNVPVLMVSGRDQVAEQAFAEESGADAFLANPFSSDQFRQRVQQLLALDGQGGEGSDE